MNVENFIKLRPYLYHLTDRENRDNILNKQRLLSTSYIVENSNIVDKLAFLTSRRLGHTEIFINETKYKIRDQRPISMLALGKCVTDGWSAADFIKHLNDRTFFWPTIKRLNTHYQRYKIEEPIIIRVKTESLFVLNDTPKFCRLNSGATRANSYLGGVAPARGANSFLTADQYSRTPGTVVEVTFDNFCDLPSSIWLGSTPYGPWEKMSL